MICIKKETEWNTVKLKKKSKKSCPNNNDNVMVLLSTTEHLKEKRA